MHLTFRKLNIIASAAFVCGILLSLKLWLPAGDGGRTVPNIPYSFCKDIIPLRLDSYLVSLLLLACANDILFIYVNKKQHAIICKITALLLVIILVLQDQIRIQPWVFLYSLFYLSAILVSAEERIVSLIRYILACMYLWAGIHKLQPDFVEQIVRPIIQCYHLPAEIKQWGFIIPLIEIIIGLLLFRDRTKRTGAWMAAGMHAFIIFHYCILLQYNLIIFPWNLFCLTMILFCTDRHAAKNNHPSGKFAAEWFILLIAGILPILHFYTHYPGYLSWTLYTGKDRTPVICIPEENIPATLRHSIIRYSNNAIAIININHWVISELNVPVYSCDTELLQQITQSIEKRTEIIHPTQEIMNQNTSFIFITR